MPVARELDCSQVSKVVLEFFAGVSVKELARHFKVTRLTITRLIERRTYKDCKNLNTMVDAIGLAVYIDKVEQQMNANKRKGRGNKREVS